MMNEDEIRNTIEQAISLSLRSIVLPGISDAELVRSGFSSEQFNVLVIQLEASGQASLKLRPEIHLFLRISNTDVLEVADRPEFLIQILKGSDQLHALAKTERDWAVAWEEGLRPIKADALRSMREDLQGMGDSLTEDSYAFKAGMVLFASELVGPYVDRIASFLGFSRSFVQVIGTRLVESKIWKGDAVECDKWFDSEKGYTAFLLDLLVAEGRATRQWSKEKGAYRYKNVDVEPRSQFTV